MQSNYSTQLLICTADHLEIIRETEVIWSNGSMQQVDYALARRKLKQIAETSSHFSMPLIPGVNARKSI